jgi:hypothetical protein
MWSSRYATAPSSCACASDGVGEWDALAVDEPAQLLLVAHRARRRGGPEERATEACALLVGPVDESHGDRWRPGLGDPAQHLGAGEHVEAAVEPAAVRHGVEVAADQHGPRVVAAEGVPVVPGGVALDLEREVRERLGEPRPGGRPGLRPGDALRAVLVSREGAKLLQSGDDAGRVERHGASLPRRARAS